MHRQSKKQDSRNFLSDDSARVPFVVIGIFFVILSTVISLNLTRMDVTMANSVSPNIEISAPDQALAYAKSDLARALNYAGMDALKTLGETPVIKADNTSDYYNGTNGDPYRFNMNRARAMTLDTFNQYLDSNYNYDAFTYSGYAVNVDSPKDRETIAITTIRMKLNRTIRPPLFEPGENSYETYWKISIPVKIRLKNPDLNGDTDTKSYTVDTPVWVGDEAQYAVDDITAMMLSDIHLDPDINYLFS